MSIDAIIMLIGTFVALLPFLGFPVSWDSVLLVILGILTIAMGIIVRRGHQRARPKQEAFVENSPTNLEHAE